MGQIVSSAAKPKRCNANQLSQVPTPAAGEHILVSSDNSMNAAGQGNFDCYIVGDGTTAATARPLNKINADIIALIADVEGNIIDKTVFTLQWTDNRLLRNNGGVTAISEGAAQYNRCAATEKVDCTAFQGKSLTIAHGGVGTGYTNIIFYNVNAGISSSYAELSGDGIDSIVVPSNATSFRLGVMCSTTAQLSGAKSSANASYTDFLLVRKTDIVDDLITDDSTKVLSAKQGKILNEELTEVSDEVETLKNLIIDEKTITFECVWVDNKLLRPNGGIGTITESDTGYYGKCAVTDPVMCSDYVGKELSISHGIDGTTDMTYLAFYNANNQLVGTAYTEFQGKSNSVATVPTNTSYFRLGIRTNLASNLAAMEEAAIVSVTIPEEKTDTIRHRLFSQELFGAIDYAMPTDFDYSQLLFFGQSFAQGGSSTPVTTGVIPNCYMFGDQLKALTGTAFNPLQLRTDTSEPYEFPVVSCANALSRMYRRYTHDINIVASTAGTSGASLQTLIESYISNVVTMQTNMKSVADGENKSVGCFAIVFMQGESDYGGRDNSTPDKDAYKALLLQTKNALQQSCMTNLGQERKPLFFIYQTSGGWVHDYTGIDNSQLGVSMAQIEFAQENDDVVLISPCYQVTTYTDNHPSCNGYRWLGEYYAKAIWQTLYRGWRFSNPIPKEFVREDNRIIIYISSCILPLKFDTWTLPRQTNYGFKVVADGTEVGITDISLENNAIVLTLSSSIASATSVKVTYGGVGVGRGNICDSDTWSTWLKYLSDANDTGYDGNRVIGQSPTAEGGGSLVGKNYPMNNFLSIFYKELVSE